MFLLEQLQSIMNGDAPALNFDPLQAAFEEVEQSTEKKPDDVRESLFLLFHGPPNTSNLNQYLKESHPYLKIF